jgi:hypothetical protein
VVVAVRPEAAEAVEVAEDGNAYRKTDSLWNCAARRRLWR